MGTTFFLAPPPPPHLTPRGHLSSSDTWTRSHLVNTVRLDNVTPSRDQHLHHHTGRVLREEGGGGGGGGGGGLIIYMSEDRAAKSE